MHIVFSSCKSRAGGLAELLDDDDIVTVAPLFPEH